MKNITTNIIITLLILAGATTYGQTGKNFDKLISKTWTLSFYEVDGKKIPPTIEQKGDRMIFTADHKVKSGSSANIKNGTWQYDAAKKALTIVDALSKENVVMNIVKITTNECILQFTNPKGNVIRLNMVPGK